MTILGLLLLAAHLGVCALVWFGLAEGRLCAGAAMLPLVVFVPLWGLVCLLMQQRPGEDPAPPELESLRVSEEIYRSVVIPGGQRRDAAPLEDVLLLDPAPTRRSRMMELLNDRPERDPELLRRASRSEDVEVVHYAATALSELNKECDLRLQRAEKACADDPGDARRRDAYIRVLADCLQKAAAPERVQAIRRRQYAALLEQRQRQTPTLETGTELVRQWMLLEELEQAGAELERLQSRWPQEEAVWLLRVEYAARRHDAPALRRVLRQAGKLQAGFTRQGREVLEFWRKGAVL